MLNSIKFLVTLSISALLILSSCSKNGVEPVPVKTIYRLTMISKNSDNSTTGTITYKDADGKMQTEAALFDQDKSFPISKGHNIFYKVTGTYNSTARPTATLSYSVERFDDDISQGIVVLKSSTVSGQGSAGRWTIEAAIDCTFDGSSCK